MKEIKILKMNHDDVLDVVERIVNNEKESEDAQLLAAVCVSLVETIDDFHEFTEQTGQTDVFCDFLKQKQIEEMKKRAKRKPQA